VKDFWRLMFLELAQNVPLISGFVVAYQFWRTADWLVALACMVAGSTLAALVIWITEPLIFEGHREAPRAVVGNALTFSVLMFSLALYLLAAWSRWWTDVLIGVVLAVALALAQEFAAKEPFGAVRAVWLAVSGAVTLLLFRWLLDAQPLLCVVLVNVWFTLVMGLYKHLRLRAQPEPQAELQ